MKTPHKQRKGSHHSLPSGNSHNQLPVAGRQLAVLQHIHLLGLRLVIVLGLLALTASSQGLSNLFIVALYGANEVANPGDPTATGTARLNFNTQTGSLFFDISLEGTTEPTDIELLYGDADSVAGTGAVGSNAAVLTLLTATTTVSSASYGTYELSGAVPADLDLIAAIVGDPTMYYVQIYTRDYPYGACRGQLASETTSATLTVSDADTSVWSGSSVGTTTTTTTPVAATSSDPLADSFSSGSASSTTSSALSAAESLAATSVVPTSTIAASIGDLATPSTVKVSTSSAGAGSLATSPETTEVNQSATTGQNMSKTYPSTVGVAELLNVLSGNGSDTSQVVEVLGDLGP